MNANDVALSKMMPAAPAKARIAHAPSVLSGAPLVRFVVDGVPVLAATHADAVRIVRN